MLRRSIHARRLLALNIVPDYGKREFSLRCYTEFQQVESHVSVECFLSLMFRLKPNFALLCMSLP